MTAQRIMVQGTGSYVGKSVISAALCCYFREEGVRVASFKAQNMSNNSFVTRDGGEISRAQAFQAAACGIEPTVDRDVLGTSYPSLELVDSSAPRSAPLSRCGLLRYSSFVRAVCVNALVRICAGGAQ